MRHFASCFLFLLGSIGFALAQDDGDGFTCCDPDQTGFFPGSCGGTFYANDGIVCDSDCPDYTDGTGCATIPLDGGLSLLALAGGGLATAAMRRRREEEEAAAQGAA